jgi:hypothetical protein
LIATSLSVVARKAGKTNFTVDELQ